jgi:hypothetical protein
MIAITDERFIQYLYGYSFDKETLSRFDEHGRERPAVAV